MSRTLWGLVVLLSACGVADPETSCFGVGDVPEAGDVTLSPVVPGEDFNHRPQTEEEAEEAMWDLLHAQFEGSDDRVLCVIDEGHVGCEPGTLGPDSRSPGRPFFQCKWDHPEAHRLPDDPQGHVFFTEDAL